MEYDVVVRKGTRITCPKCGAVIAIAKRDIRGRETIDSENLEWLIKEFRYGDELSCPYCSAPVGLDLGLKIRGDGEVYVGAVIHTSEGWVPKAIYELMKDKIESYIRCGGGCVDEG